MLPSIAQHAKSHGIIALKSLGQNFIYDLSLCRKIASTANITKDDYVLEIGPGTAGLTRSILEMDPKKLIVIEKDRRCINLLSEVKSEYHRLEILESDALSISLKDIKLKFEIPESSKLKIVANLPYNIATKLITDWLYQYEDIELISVMVQKEVADRMSSKESLKSYGRLSIICQLVCEVKKLFDVSPESFYPRPKIWSSIVFFSPKEFVPEMEVLKLIEKLTEKAFGMRRKMLRVSLKEYENLISDFQIGNLRAENLKPEDYLALAKKILEK